MLQANIALGAYPARNVRAAMSLAGNAYEPLLGKIGLNHVQICPQNTGTLDANEAKSLVKDFPETQFRLHANARVAGWSSKPDCGSFGNHVDYFKNLAKVSQALGASAYTLHAGNRSDSSFQKMLNNIYDIQELFGCAVGVEGMYPTQDDRYLLSTWSEYQALLESRMGYALDLSHINILAAKTGRIEMSLLKELLASKACLEIHLSDNNGEHDHHDLLIEEPWWWGLMKSRNSDAIIFTEGNQIHQHH